MPGRYIHTGQLSCAEQQHCLLEVSYKHRGAAGANGSSQSVLCRSMHVLTVWQQVLSSLAIVLCCTKHCFYSQPCNGHQPLPDSRYLIDRGAGSAMAE
jgi:hypothetical protein